MPELKRKLSDAVIDNADYLRSIGLDVEGADGANLSGCADWFAGVVGTFGIAEPLLGKIKSEFVKQAGFALSNAEKFRNAKPCGKAEVNHDENHC